VKARDIPNLISIFRILLVPPVVMSMLAERYDVSLGLFVLAGVSDGLDGYLARRFNWMSPLGALLDPIGDKLLLVSSFLVLGWIGELPWWLVALVILRDVIIVSGTLLYKLIVEEPLIEPLLSSKINTLCQILLVAFALLKLAGFGLIAPAEQLFEYVVLVTTVVSGVAYVALWGQRARRKLQARQP
jgi:cardiolipin synthase